MSYPLELEVRQEIVKAASLMHLRGLIGGHDGNISVRLGENRVVTTPAAVNKGFLQDRDLVLVDLEGKLLRGSTQPSSELQMHLLVYRRRPDVRCVIHAHPPHCVACTLVGLSLAAPVVPEMAFLVGAVPTAPYATPGTPEVPAALEPYVGQAQAILLERHGSVTFGQSVMAAYNRLESLEHIAQVVFLAHNLGKVAPLTPDQLDRLRDSVTARGLAWPFDGRAPLDGPLLDSIVARVVAELKKS